MGWLWLACALPGLALGAKDVRARIESLALEAGFSVEGLDWLGAEATAEASGAPAEKLQAWLREYNYLIVGGAGGIERLIISSPKRTGQASRDAGGGSSSDAYVKTTRDGVHHKVDALLVGPNGIGKPVALIVDTGASSLVLPASLSAELGFGADDLENGVSQTAGGQTQVKFGTLASVRVGAARAEGVKVSFIEDRRLNGAALLGMSFLGRFRMTIDDERGELVLLVK
jgi:aspartyl protease family protein